MPAITQPQPPPLPSAPIQGQRILLRGFDPNEEAAARRSLLARGYEIVQSITLADRLLIGMGNPGNAVKAARQARIPVEPWRDFEAGAAAAAAPADSAGPGLHPAVEVGPDSVRILDQVLPRVRSASPLVPPAELFRHLCLDAGFLRNARAVAAGVRHGLPVALEGDPATAKTSAILWVAHLIGQPVLRLNLHGQSDTGELIGRYVPADQGTPAGAESEDRWWNKQTPDLQNSVESRPTAAWRFQEGTIPQAMREGIWVILDELNLAEPQVLERLNPVLEQPPTLLVSEGPGTLFGTGQGVPVAPGFHLFATMNPAEYAGRSVLSPAFRDRWLLWHHAEPPGEAGFACLLRRLLHGEQPEFVFRGVRYQAPRTEPVYPELGGAPGVTELIPRLALFHASLGGASGMGGSTPSLGRLRRERYLFTRRTLLACLRVLHHLRAADPRAALDRLLRDAIELAYLDRIRDGADRDAALALLRAAGLEGAGTPR